MKNIGKIDRIIRLVVAVGLIILYATGILTGTWGIVALAAAGIFIITSLVSFCPLYAMFGINSCPVKK
jgi:hypothetical protein